MFSPSDLPRPRAASAVRLAGVLLSAALAGSPSPAFAGPPDLPDLNVTHISRTPRYPAYVLKYEQLPGSGPEAMPQVADPQTGQAVTPEQAAKIKRWPDLGEEVTFAATVCNHGTKPTGKFGYRWYIDENVVADGQHDSLDGPSLVTEEYEEVELGGEKFKLAKRVAGTYCALEYKWQWQPGRHYVRIEPLDTPVGGVRKPVYVACSAKALFVSDEGAEGAASPSVHEFAIEGDGFRFVAAHRLANEPAAGAGQNRAGVPAGLAYDAKQNVLVVVDRVNRRLQTIKISP